MVYTINFYRNTWESNGVQICDATTLISSISMRFEQKPEVGEEIQTNNIVFTIHNFRYSIQGIVILCVGNE